MKNISDMEFEVKECGNYGLEVVDEYVGIEREDRVVKREDRVVKKDRARDNCNLGINEKRIIGMINSIPEVFSLFNRIEDEVRYGECDRSNLMDIICKFSSIKDNLNERWIIYLESHGVDFDFNEKVNSYIKLEWGEGIRYYRLRRDEDGLKGFREDINEVKGMLSSDSKVIVYDRRGDILAKNFIE